MSVSAGFDPYYSGPAAQHIQRWVRDRLGYRVESEPTMRDRLVEVDQGRGEIRVQRGRSLWEFHSDVGMASLWIIGGDSWVPDFMTDRRLRLVKPGDCSVDTEDVPTGRTGLLAALRKARLELAQAKRALEEVRRGEQWPDHG